MRNIQSQLLRLLTQQRLNLKYVLWKEPIIVPSENFYLIEELFKDNLYRVARSDELVLCKRSIGR